MRFDEEGYFVEMQKLIFNAKAKLLSQHPDMVVYTINIWTDPDATISAVNLDTFENSALKVSVINKFLRKEHERLLSVGDDEIAHLFLPLPDEGRNYNPADFALREFVTVENKSFDYNWEGKSKAKCWDVLEPALKRVGEAAMLAFSDLPLHPKAELSVNSRRDWYDQRWQVRSEDVAEGFAHDAV